MEGISPLCLKSVFWGWKGDGDCSAGAQFTTEGNCAIMEFHNGADNSKSKT